MVDWDVSTFYECHLFVDGDFFSVVASVKWNYISLLNNRKFGGCQLKIWYSEENFNTLWF